MLDSVRIRLTLWYVSVLAFVLIAFSVGVYSLLSSALHDRVDESLRALMQITIKSLTNDEEEGQTPEGAAQSTAAELFNPEQALAIFDASGRLLAENTSSDDFYAQLPDPSLILQDEVSLYTVEDRNDDGEHHRMAVRRVTIPPLNTPYIVLATQPLERIEDELESLREILYYLVPLALLLAGIGGWFLARKSLAPVVSMSEQARRIGAKNLEQRLLVENPRDELGRLAAAFNELLSRLSAAFVQQRQFMADASHELRTPLSVMRTAADVTLEKPHREEDEYRDAIKMIGEQTRRLTRIVEDMFTLARADAGRYPLRASRFYLDELIEETARVGRVLAAQKDVTVDVAASSEFPFHGDEDLLRQMLLNLLGNAIKHTPPGGAVRLGIILARGEYLISISDTGSGIPPEARPHIFERFYRVDKARSRSETASGAGAGLGLSISLWIAEAHGGSLGLARSDGDGSTFVVALPAPAQ
ncbi:MAG TPA: ATP-binding protein [Blastocatellia bacterium]|nr:ATP-binding protein [Blastocatellia bacterium]